MVTKYFDQKTSIIPLVIFRIAFGLVMTIGQIRFLANGWVKELLLTPTFHFTFTGFDWVKPLPDLAMYGVVILSIISAFMICSGLLYRWATIAFFLSFTYLELIDVTYYLNHYYLVSLLSFLLIFVPAHHYWSLDVMRSVTIKQTTIRIWSVNLLKVQIALVYIFAGIAKIQYDWLIAGQPLKIWLLAKSEFPVIGPLFEMEWFVLLFAWTGMLFDCLIIFFLWKQKTRLPAYIVLVVFHIMTALLFNIGMFPWIMIGISLLFFTLSDWQRLIPRLFKSQESTQSFSTDGLKTHHKTLIALYLFIQLIVPMRSYVYQGHTLWTEEGYRFSWHVMLVEKNGYCQFNLKDKLSGKTWTIDQSKYLTPLQRKQLAFQPDLILQFARHLKAEHEAVGVHNLEIKVINRVSLNGRKSTVLIDPKVDLLTISSIWNLDQAMANLWHGDHNAF